jgi:hypothetical protein
MQPDMKRSAPVITPSLVATAREMLFESGRAGTRCLLDEPLVCEIAAEARQTLALAKRLPAAAVAIQAIAFDKTPAANWKVTWHQDVMFPFARPVNAKGFTLASKKAPKTIIGYYTLSSFSIELTSLPEDLRKSSPGIPRSLPRC